MSVSTQPIKKVFAAAQDFLPLKGTDFVEFYVSNAEQAAYYYRTAFGFQPLAKKGLQTGSRDVCSFAIRQDKITFVFTSPLKSGTEVGKHIDLHGDGVKHIALWVDDARLSFEETTKRGAEAVAEPYEVADKSGKVVYSSIKTYGDTVHLFVDRSEYNGVFLPGFEKWESDFKTEPIGLKFVDHMVGNVELGKMNRWVDFYEQAMGFTQLVSFDDKDISTKYTALMSMVMSNGNGRIKFPINEPADGKKKSQIEEYLDFYEGPGVQHIAIATDDIIQTVGELRKRGIEFLYVPEIYYDDLLDRVGSIDEDLARLKKLNILVDRDDEGYLLQIFTRPVQPRPTVFFEIIQRKGAKSFGKGNFKALFEAIEREQELRGTL